jgi:hypothetical protein
VKQNASPGKPWEYYYFNFPGQHFIAGGLFNTFIYARRLISYSKSADASKAESSAAITWKKKIPLLTNVFMLKDIATVLVIACGAMLVLLLLISGGEDLDQIIPLWVVCSLIVGGLMVFAMLAVFFNRMNMESGVGPESASRPSKA